MKKKSKEDELYIEEYMNLAAAVVERAVIDYYKALKKLERHPRDNEAKRTVSECERFFRRDIGIYSDADGESVIRAVKKRVEESDNKDKRYKGGFH